MIPKQNDILFMKPADPLSDMAVLSYSNHVIMTVGTYGWWSGILSGGNVIYQLKDFVDLSQPTTQQIDHFLPYWTGIY